MARFLLTFAFTATLLLCVPAVSKANTAIEVIENDYEDVAISVKSSTVYVKNANGEMLYVYNVAGVRVVSIKVDGQDRHYDLNLPKGCYIVKVGKKVRKVSIK